MSIKQLLEDTLRTIEMKGDKIYTLTLHEIGTYSNDDIVVGRVEDRTCQWKVEIYKQRDKFHHERKSSWKGGTPKEVIEQEIAEDNKKVDMEEDLFFLNGVYNSFEEIEDKIQELRLKNAVELYETEGQGSLKAYRRVGEEENTWEQEHCNEGKKVRTVWETTCGVCNDVQKSRDPNCICQGTLESGEYCSNSHAKKMPDGVVLCNNFSYMIPQTILENISVNDGKIYYSTGGSFSVLTELGKITPVYPKPHWGLTNNSC